MEIVLAGETLRLLPDKALYWPRQQTLFIADAHFGKVAAFRAAGIPLPPGSTSAALARLTECLAATGAKQLVFLGDFLHSREGRAGPTFARFAAWRRQHGAINIKLVRGNHDDRAGDPPPDWHIECVDEGEVVGPFCLSHHPEPDLRGYVLAGHIHPAIHLGGPAGDSLRLPCFWFGAYVCVLPAFGEFTGTYVVRPREGDRVFVAADGKVIELGASREV